MYTREIDKCEICGVDIDGITHRHHIVPRTDKRSTNHFSNLAFICPNCHYRVHNNEIIIEGVFLTTDGPKLFHHKSGEDFIVREGVILLPDGTAEIR